MKPVDPSVAPPLKLLFGELRVARDWMRARTRPTPHVAKPVGKGAPVITIPGFCANDLSMRQMRMSLRTAGFRARGWGMGTNFGARPDTLDELHKRVEDVYAQDGRAVHLIGWSLGGIYAREYAKRFPDNVASVITMGTPFSGSLQANNAWRLYQLVAGHSIDAPPIPFGSDAKPPVPTIALWSRNDGIIAANSARGKADESDAAIEVDCGHMGFAYAPEAVDTVIDCLTKIEGAAGL